MTIDDLIQKSINIEASQDPDIIGDFYCCCHIARRKLERAKLLISFDPNKSNLIAEAEAILAGHH